MSEHGIKEQFDLVSEPDILSKIVKEYHSKIVGEENNVKLLWCACISKDLPKEYRLSVIITSQSSAGKSNLVNNVLQPFQDSVLDFTDYTPAYLQRSEINMNGKIFKMEQMERTNDKKQVSLGNLKFMLSEGKLKMGLVDTNDKGKREPKTIEISGIPVFISTSTNYNIDPETLNRTFLMQVDETEDQTKKIISHIMKKYSNLGINEKWNKELENLKEYSKIFKEMAHQIRGMYIPFADKLIEQIPSSNISIRRDLEKILNLACVIAFLHFPNRIKIANNEGENFIVDQWANTEKKYTYFLVVDQSDFKEALGIGDQTIKQTLNKLNQSSMDIYTTLAKLFETSEMGISIKDLADQTKYSANRARELVNQLVNSGHVSRERSNSREFLYSPTFKKFDNISTEKIDFSQEDVKTWIKNQLNGNSEKYTILYPNNDIIKKLT